MKSMEIGGEMENQAVEFGEDLGEEQAGKGDENALRFLDSMDAYLTLFDSLSSTLRKGWLELAGAKHSMGASRISSAMLDLKVHSAATSLQVTLDDDGVDSAEQPHFSLSKWGLLDSGNRLSEEENFEELEGKFDSPQLRRRGNPQISGEKTSADGALLKVDDKVQKERSKSLSVFGTLVSPKLRAAQLSFETALETLVEIANMRSELLSSFVEVQKEIEVNRRTA